MHSGGGGPKEGQGLCPWTPLRTVVLSVRFKNSYASRPWSSLIIAIMAKASLVCGSCS